MRDEPEQKVNTPSATHQSDGGTTARKAARSVTSAKSTTKSTTKPGAKQPTKKTPAKKRAKATAMPAFDRRMLERQMAEISRLLQNQDFETEEEVNAFLQQITAQGGPVIPQPTTPLEEAQELAYQAMEAAGKRRETLARQALAISPDCADAYVVLAESSSDLAKARQFYEEGMQAGERALGAEMFADITGQFWGFIESRPYMRAREGLAHVLWGLGEREAAIGHFQEMLRLNPNDNQGVRYNLASWLLAVGGEQELQQLDALLKQFPEEGSAFWAYTTLLLKLRQNEMGKAADAALEEAMTSNPFVPFYLLGILPFPKQPPDYYGFGDQNEAVIYLEEGGVEAWIKREDDIAWLAEAIVRLAPPDLLGDDEPAHQRRGRPRQRK
jgi:tetratricopeptide (TPR) repeat protein